MTRETRLNGRRVSSTQPTTTRRIRFLATMDVVVPWAHLTRLITPYYPKKGNGREPVGVETMLRIFLLQKWFCLSDPQAEDTIRDSVAMRGFVGIDAGARIPDETTILRFRHLLDKHDLTRVVADEVDSRLASRHLRIRSGTIVDAAVVRAP